MAEYNLIAHPGSVLWVVREKNKDGIVLGVEVLDLLAISVNML